MEDLVKALVKDCLDWQEKYLKLEADVKYLSLIAIGKAECMFLSDNDFVNIIAENIEKMRNTQNINQNKYGLREENPDSQLCGTEVQD